MSDYKFTPGPWKIQMRTTPGQFVRETHIVSADESHIAEVSPCAIEANAKLIAAAPELLNALKKLLSRYIELVDSGDCGCWDPHKDEEIIQAKYALSKAITI